MSSNEGAAAALAGPAPGIVTPASATATPAQGGAPPQLGTDASELRLPNAKGKILGFRDALHVVVSKKALFADGKRIVESPPLGDMASMGFGEVNKRNGRNDLYVVPLGAFLQSRDGAESSALLSMDADVPFRALVEVAFTLGHHGAGRILLATSDRSSTEAGRVRGFQLNSTAEAEAFLVFLVSDGLSVKFNGVNVAPGCRAPGAGLAVPNRAGRYDFDAFSACLARLRADGMREAPARGENPTLGALAALPNTRFEDVVLAIQAADDAGVDVSKLRIPH